VCAGSPRYDGPRFLCLPLSGFRSLSGIPRLPHLIYRGGQVKSGTACFSSGMRRNVPLANSYHTPTQSMGVSSNIACCVKIYEESGLHFLRLNNRRFVQAKVQCIVLFIYFEFHRITTVPRASPEGPKDSLQQQPNAGTIVIRALSEAAREQSISPGTSSLPLRCPPPGWCARVRRLRPEAPDRFFPRSPGPGRSFQGKGRIERPISFWSFVLIWERVPCSSKKESQLACNVNENSQ
jgi:hypothetical protein